MATSIEAVMRRWGILQQKRSAVGAWSILGALVGIAGGALLLKTYFSARRLIEDSGFLQDSINENSDPDENFMKGEVGRPAASLDASSGEDVTPPHGDMLARSVGKVTTSSQRQ